MRMLSVISFILFLQLISAQYDSQPMTFQPIPVLLRFPNSAQTNPANQRIPDSTQMNPAIQRITDSVQTNPASSRFHDSVQTNPASPRFPDSAQMNPASLRFQESAQANPGSQRITDSVQTNLVSSRFPDSAQTNPASLRFSDSAQMNPASLRFQESAQTNPGSQRITDSMQTNPASLRFSDSAQMNPASMRFKESVQTNPTSQGYSFINNDRNENFAVSVRNANGLQNYRPNLRRYDAPIEMPNKLLYATEGTRNARYEGRFNRIFPENLESVRSGWQPSKNFEQRAKRPKYSRKDAISIHRNILNEDKIPAATEVRRNPKVVKYIADENGFAIREDLVKPLEDTIARSRQKSRILTASSSPIMAKVVSSAIRVSNHQSSSSGKFLPQIMDLKLGK